MLMDTHRITFLKKNIAILFFLFFFFQSSISNAYAYLPNSAFTLPLSSELPIGSIIAETSQGYVAAQGKEDEAIIGILVENADFVYQVDETTSRPVASSGIIPTLLSNEMGQISYGTPITISKTQPGVGVKAQEQDEILGVAQESINIATPRLTKMKILYDGDYGSSLSLKDNSVFAQELENLIKQSSNKIANADTNPTVYLLAIIVVILAAIFAFILFGRVAINGINALGRNPLAKSAIITGIVINALLIIAFVIGVLFAAAYIVGW